MSQPQRSVLVVIPTYQEAANIETVLTRVRTVSPDVHVLVVDDNSPDGTARLAEKVGEKLGNIDVLRRPDKSGLGSAYREGFNWGLERSYDVLVEMDADLSHDPDDLPELINRINDGADLVIGSRYVPGGAVPGWPIRRLLLSRYANLYARTALQLPVRDATAGYRAYRAEFIRKIDLDHVRADGYGFQIEMAYRMHRAGARIREIPVTFVDRTEGVSKMSPRIILEAFLLVAVWGARDVVKRVRREARKRRG